MKDFFNHPSAIIDKNCVVGKNTKIWHWSHISESSIIGENCIIGQNVFVGDLNSSLLNTFNQGFSLLDNFSFFFSWGRISLIISLGSVMKEYVFRFLNIRFFVVALLANLTSFL